MNELWLHIEYVQRHPRDHIAALSLVDRIEEENGLTHREALRAVADYVVVSRNNHAVLLATRICRKGTRYVHTLAVIIAWHLNEPETRFNILIRDGWQAPIYSASPAGTRRTRRRTAWATVGARWLIVRLRNHLRQITKVKKELKAGKWGCSLRHASNKTSWKRHQKPQTNAEAHT